MRTPLTHGLSRALALATAALALMLAGSAPAQALEKEPPKVQPPVNTTAPTVSGTPAIGKLLTCSTGIWTNNPTSFSYAWLRDGAPIPGQSASVYLVQPADAGHKLACQVTAGNGGGSYTIAGLASGSYAVSFYSESAGSDYLYQYFAAKKQESEATPVAVSSPSATGGVNAELQKGGQISGLVTAAGSHAPVAEVLVCAEENSAKPIGGGCAFTSASGEYTISGLLSASYTVKFLVFFGAETYFVQYYNGKASAGEADPIVVTAPTTVAGVNAELVSTNQGGQISGVVTKEGGGALAGIEVCGYTSSEVEFVSRCATTNASGEYTLAGLPEAQFTVSFSGENCMSSPCTKSNFVSQYYNAKANYTEATPVSVAKNTTTSGIDAKMVEGGMVEGRVTRAADESPLAGAQVCADTSGVFQCAQTGPNGEYTVEGLPESPSVTVQAYAITGNYLFAETQVAVKTGLATKGVNLKLSEGGQIAGRVTSATTHAAVSNLLVCAESTGGIINGFGCASTNANGEYTVSRLSTGSYNVFFIPEIEGEFLSLESAGVSATQGSTTPLNVELHTGGQITGVVTDAATHAGVGNVRVCASAAHLPERCALTAVGNAAVAASSAGVTVPGAFTMAKPPKFDAKTDDIDFFFNFPVPGKLSWSLFFRNADVGFADSLGISLGEAGVGAEASRHKGHGKAKCKRTQTRHHGRCVATLVPFAAGSRNVPAGTVEVKVHADAKAIKALKAGRTLHVSGHFTFQSTFGGAPFSESVAATVKQPKKRHKGKGKHR